MREEERKGGGKRFIRSKSPSPAHTICKGMEYHKEGIFGDLLGGVNLSL